MLLWVPRMLITREVMKPKLQHGEAIKRIHRLREWETYSRASFRQDWIKGLEGELRLSAVSRPAWVSFPPASGRIAPSWWQRQDLEAPSSHSSPFIRMFT